MSNLVTYPTSNFVIGASSTSYLIKSTIHSLVTKVIIKRTVTSIVGYSQLTRNEPIISEITHISIDIIVVYIDK